jgi:opacity protein-like surface antigen
LVENPKPRNSAGLSIGVINAGVSNIDGRDNNGLPTGELSTSENQFYLAFANRFSDKLSVGITAKFYYYKLFEEINTTSFGVDIGAVYKVNDQFTVALAVIDINSKYKWDTSPVYERGVITEDKFPNLRKLGVSYLNKEIGLLASFEYENSSAETNILRAGVEYNIYESLYLRGGIDQFNLSNTDWPVRPSLGFSFYKSFGNFKVGVDYAFVIEQYSSNDRHIIGLTFNF